MALQCKMFRERKSSELESKINEWFLANEDITIAHITHSEDSQFGNVIIFYSRKMEFEKVK